MSMASLTFLYLIGSTSCKSEKKCWRSWRNIIRSWGASGNAEDAALMKKALKSCSYSRIAAAVTSNTSPGGAAHLRPLFFVGVDGSSPLGAMAASEASEGAASVGGVAALSAAAPGAGAGEVIRQPRAKRSSVSAADRRAAAAIHRATAAHFACALWRLAVASRSVSLAASPAPAAERRKERQRLNASRWINAPAPAGREPRLGLLLRRHAAADEPAANSRKVGPSSVPHKTDRSRPKMLMQPINSIKLMYPLRFTSRKLTASSMPPILKRKASSKAPKPCITTRSSRCAYKASLAWRCAASPGLMPDDFSRSAISSRLSAHGVLDATLSPPLDKTARSTASAAAFSASANAADALCRASASVVRYQRTKGSVFALCSHCALSLTVAAKLPKGIATLRPPFRIPSHASSRRSRKRSAAEALPAGAVPAEAAGGAVIAIMA
mmetsp:Transcript_44161/g.127503  ORF Transcript_44161/g.127503 Transcript_44161/m.127503 type:complete len:440 (-) Transcript_44161:379-1698(-)